MTILIIVTASTMLIFRGIAQAWRSGEMRTERYQQARLLFDLFTRELSSCVASARFPVVGMATSGDHLKTGSEHAELFFVGALPGRTGLVERGYWVNADGELMCHDEEPADGDYAATGVDELCANEVQDLEFAYFNGTGWIETWDARSGGPQAGQLPKAVRVSLTIGKPKAESFETVIRIPTS